MRPPLFAYGTLQFPVIIEVVIGRVPAMIAATASDHEVRHIPGVQYPGLVSVPGGSASGVLIGDLSEMEWSLLDEYEDAFYSLDDIVVCSNGNARVASAYRVPLSMVSSDYWDPRLFEARYLDVFVGEIRRELRP